MSDRAQKDIWDTLSGVFSSLSGDAQMAFKFSNPKFEYIPASFDIEKAIRRKEEFEKSIPRPLPNLLEIFSISELFDREVSANIEKNITDALKLINSKTRRPHKKLSREDLLYLVRIFGFFSEKNNGAEMFYKYYSEDLESVLMTNPLRKIDTYQGVVFHFRADDDTFKIKEGIYIRRLYPWEYTELIVEMLKMRNVIRIPASETLAEANFILEINSKFIRGDDYWARLLDLRRFVDIISVAAKGHVWVPLFMIRKQGLIQWNEGIKGRDFSGLVGVISHEQTPSFINRIKKGLNLRNNTIFESASRSLRQEEEDYGFEFRLVRLFSSLEMLLGSPGVGCGMRLAWLLGKDQKQRKVIFKDFEEIKDLRDKIVHKVLLYDLMASGEKSKTLHSIDKLHDWLFDALAHFLDSDFSLKDWQESLNLKLFGG